PKEATNYYVRYPSFQKVFRAPLIQPTDSLKILSSPDCLGFVERKDGAGLVNLILLSLGALFLKKNSFDVLLIYLPQAWRACFELLAYDKKEFTTDRKGNPFLSYQEMQSVLSRSLLIYQNGHSGRIPRKIFVHKTSHFTEDEIQGAVDAFGIKTELELVQIVR